MATFVLVHGAWHGGWCWRRVSPLLRAAGHEVYTPTLTGLGERSHLLRPEIDLNTHVADVLGLLDYEDLREAVLVGHSYGGMVITAVAEAVPEQIRGLVYLDAFVPRDGQSLVDIIGGETARTRYQERAQAGGDGWRLPPFAPEQYGVVDPGDVQWVGARLEPHPLKCFQQPVRVQNPEAAGLPRLYIRCAEPLHPLLDDVTAWVQDEGWAYRELPTGHDAMITMPRELAALLLETVQEPPRYAPGQG